ncbi:LysR substrate-binding domain-containing protein [Novosphingobium resinovorum]
MQRFVGNVRPRFVLGLIPSGFHDRLPQVIQRYRMIAPEIDLSLIEMNSMEQVEALKDGRIDAGLGRVRIEDDGIRRELLREEPVLAAFPRGACLDRRTNRSTFHRSAPTRSSSIPVARAPVTRMPSCPCSATMAST